MKNINTYIQEKLVIDKDVEVQHHVIDNNNVCFQVRVWGYSNDPNIIEEIGFTLRYIDNIDIDNYQLKETQIHYKDGAFVMKTEKQNIKFSITKNNYVFVHDSTFYLRIFYLNKNDMTNFINDFPIDLINKNSIPDSEDDIAIKVTQYVNEFFDMKYEESNKSIHLHSPLSSKSKYFIKDMFNYYNENTK